MKKAANRIEVFYKIRDSRAEILADKLHIPGYDIKKLFITDNYLINMNFNSENINVDNNALTRPAQKLKNSTDFIEAIAKALTQPITQKYEISSFADAHTTLTRSASRDFSFAFEIGYLPGVTDNIAHTVMEIIEDITGIEPDRENSVFSSTTYFLDGKLTKSDVENISRELYNPLIQRVRILSRDEYIKNSGMGFDIPTVALSENNEADIVPLNVSDTELALLGREGIKDSSTSRRGPLALDMLSMNVIKNYFSESEKRDPTDIELESIAQTWSEHCKHTIFSASIDDDLKEGIYSRYIKEATIRIRREKGDKDFCVSVFSDNAGGIVFDDEYIIADKVETHNSPSALDPFGGSITGIVGVNRDAMGFGLGAKPVANRYGFCFADPSDSKPIYRDPNLKNEMLSPRRIMDGVIHGVNAGGNTSGIPTPQGFVYFDDRFKGKPLVFVGTVGLIPKKISGKSSVIKKAIPGDLIVMAGGRVGLDGIHGATFSSEALSSGSPSSAVQIGDPITQKKLSDAIVKEARELELYNSITDNGAGGLSCSVAEMAKESGGFEVDLELVPLKYHGLSPWQIWVSESQERMTLSVPESKIEKFSALMKSRGVECAVIGKFNSSSRGIVRFKGKKIFDLDMNFLHDGLPKKILKTEKNIKKTDSRKFEIETDLTEDFISMAGRLNTAGFDFISTQYDHEVQGGSVIKPLQGKGLVNGSASVIRPLLDRYTGVVLSQGLYPSYSELDPYSMAACSIDTAVRNAVAAGADIERLAILDNFCWCDSNNPERLWQLKEASRACYDTAVAYGTPFISGKDSMFNDFKGFISGADKKAQSVEISIPPTLLISSIGITGDIRKCQSMDFKFPGDLIYLLGNTSEETGGSEYFAYKGEKISGEKFTGEKVPSVNAPEFLKIYRALNKCINKELLSSSIGLDRGGLALALAKSSMAGLLGFNASLSQIKTDGVLRDDFILFSESQGRILVSVNPEKQKQFEDNLSGLPFFLIGKVDDKQGIEIAGSDGKNIIKTSVEKVLKSYRSRFLNF